MEANNQKRASFPGRQQRHSSLAKGVLTHNRFSLGTISFMKNIELAADGPTRVIVRLERLMGSDRIRITDAKYMTTLLQRLREEEEVTWQKRTRERRKAEYSRFRQLVIDGYTEPTPAMEDLYNHPVFRVNRILNRLTKLSDNITPTIHLPPIVPIDPFKYDNNGRIFKLYPGHLPFAQEESLSDSDEEKDEADSIQRSSKILQDEVDEFGVMNYKKVSRGDDIEEENTKVESSLYGSDSSAEHHRGHSTLSTPSSAEKHTGHIAFSDEPVAEVRLSANIRKPKSDDATKPEPQQVLTLRQIQKKYGIVPNVNLGVQWKPYQSPILDRIFKDEKRGMRDFYNMGAKIVDMYDRQQRTTDNYITALNEITSAETNVAEIYDIVDEEVKFKDGTPLGEYYYNENEDEEGVWESNSSKQSGERDASPPTWDDLDELREDLSQEGFDEEEDGEEG